MKIRLILGGVLAIVLAAGWLAWQSESASVVDEPQAQRLGKADCSPLGASCWVTAGRLRLELAFPARVRALQPFTMELTLRGMAPVDSVVVEMNMEDMDMGVNRFVLKPAPGKEGVWQGTAMLPACMSGRSDWVADVTVAAEERRYQARFPFVLEP